jgi:hypothetical protein
MAEKISQTRSTRNALGKNQAAGSIRDASPRALHRTQMRFNLTIYDEPASLVLEWRRRGIVCSARDVLLQSLRALHKQILETDMASIQLDRIRSRKDEAPDDE